jgi:hypothetical protein
MEAAARFFSKCVIEELRDWQRDDQTLQKPRQRDLACVAPWRSAIQLRLNPGWPAGPQAADITG